MIQIPNDLNPGTIGWLKQCPSVLLPEDCSPAQRKCKVRSLINHVRNHIMVGSPSLQAVQHRDEDGVVEVVLRAPSLVVSLLLSARPLLESLLQLPLLLPDVLGKVAALGSPPLLLVTGPDLKGT